ncbi:hypothetical protein EVAR_102227_1 [Eumeta japonica]|uniref:Uncharacterized protein n=1 Tax=Eumeta variegata TaxID=151549 RepID=A0A4C1WGL1_EUMVA|nr:hypothetical protein EVAR_102227_1 [Eumeta japonica]
MDAGDLLTPLLRSLDIDIRPNIEQGSGAGANREESPRYRSPSPLEYNEVEGSADAVRATRGRCVGVFRVQSPGRRCRRADTLSRPKPSSIPNIVELQNFTSRADLKDVRINWRLLFSYFFFAKFAKPSTHPQFNPGGRCSGGPHTPRICRRRRRAGYLADLIGYISVNIRTGSRTRCSFLSASSNLAKSIVYSGRGRRWWRAGTSAGRAIAERAYPPSDLKG